MILIEEFENLMTKKTLQSVSNSKEPRTKLSTTVSLRLKKYYDPNPSEHSNCPIFSPQKTSTARREDARSRIRLNKPAPKTRSTLSKLSDHAPSSLSCSKAVLHLDEEIEFALKKRTISIKRLSEQISRELEAQAKRKGSISQMTKESEHGIDSPTLGR